MPKKTDPSTRSKGRMNKPKAATRRKLPNPNMLMRPLPMNLAVSANSRRPNLRPSANGVEVTHSELCGEITMNYSAFTVTPLSLSFPGYDINPRCAALFPWLGKLAANYEQYKFVALRFRLVSAQPSTASGRVYMAVDYDFDDPVPTTVGSMMANHTALDASVWQTASLEVDVNDLHRDMPWKYVQSPKRTDPEPRTVFGGFLIIAGAGMAAATTYNLWVDYVCRLQIPQLDTEVYFDASPPYTAATAITTADGAGTFVGSPPILATPTSLEEVIPGLENTPILARGTVNFTSAWDVASAWIADIGVRVTIAETGITPANVLLKYPSFRFDVFDALGVLLTSINGDSRYVFRDSFGPFIPSEVNTAGKDLTARATLYLNQLRCDFPTTRYIVPFVMSNSAIGAGFSGVWFRGWT